MTELTLYLKNDYRITSLEITIKGLNNSIDILKNQVDKIQGYDGDWFMEESESIYGLAFIAFQHYINGSIKDFVGETKDKEKLYNLEQNSVKYSKSKIELIISLANYAKHKDEGAPHQGTKDILDYFNLNYKDVSYLDKSAIFQGLTILNRDWDLLKINELVTEWRELLWSKSIEVYKETPKQNDGLK